MKYTISLVVPNWNGGEKLKRHLLTVLEVAKESSISEIVVVDDASTDNSVKVLSGHFPGVKVIAKKKNTGFSSTVNLGLGQVSSDLVVLLNNDASPQRDFLKSVIPHFDNEKVFSVGCNVGGLWAMAHFENGFFWHGQAPKNSKVAGAHQTLWVSGGSGIFRKKIWDELGGLDTLFDPFYEEDVDLGFRATKRGYINLWEPASRVTHYQEEGVISSHFPRGKIEAIAQRNQLIFIWKNITSPRFMAQHRHALMQMTIGHPGYARVVGAALLKLPEILKKRKIEKNHAKLTDEEVLQIFAP